MNLSNPAPHPLPPMFPQPVGSVYNLNSANEVGNVPTGPSVSVGLCLNENALYIKTLQNGQPALLGYRLVPMEGSGAIQSNSATTNYDEVINKLNERISKLENCLLNNQKNENKPVGGNLDWQV
ncbi:MAG: hypothetical protein MR911_10415 [Spirochaetia bacterium]|nr:hypothetical protein [Spirochaetia bacterium]